ncbi:unnamed protein product [Closterium sp. NIES-53]
MSIKECARIDNWDLLEQHLLAAETSVVAVGAARGTPRTPFFEGCSPSPLAPSYASFAAIDALGAEDVEVTSASGKHRSSKGKGGRSSGGGSGGDSGGGTGGGGGSGGGGSGGSGGGSGGVGGGGGCSGGSGGSGGSGSGGSQGGAVLRGGSGSGQRQQQQRRSNLKHMERRQAWLQHIVKHGKFSLQYIPTAEQPADFLTKAPHYLAFNRCSVTIGQVRLADVGDGGNDMQQ